MWKRSRNPGNKSNPTPLGTAPPRAGVHVHLPEEIIADILSRLPGKSVLRFRAVSTAWRRITTDPHFLAAHARRRPLELVLCTLLERRPWTGHPAGYSKDLSFDSIPITATDPVDQRRLIRYPHYCIETPGLLSYKCPGNLPIASCGGVLLSKMENGLYLICNPVTRLWTELPRLPQGCINECGLYFHQSSGEYRLLCRRDVRGAMFKYYITSTGATEPRHVTTVDVDESAHEVLRLIHYITTVAVQDRLYWMSTLSTGDRKIVSFDTVSEVFHMMPAPLMSSECVQLFDMNNRLAAANFGKTHIDLWFLEDYYAGEWVHQHQIVTPPMLKVLGDPQQSYFSRVTAASDDEENIILGKTGNLMVYNVRTKTTRDIDFIRESERGSSRRRILFRESLMPHEVWSSACHPLFQFG